MSVFSSALIEAIHAAAEATHAKCREYDRDPVPDRVTLQALVEMAFFTSLRTEEGQPLFVRVTHLAKERLESRGRLGGNVAFARFAEEYPFGVEELAKLAPSLNARTASFAIVGSAPALRIAGLVQFGPDNSPLTELPRHVPPLGLGVLAKGPGRLAITFGFFLVGLFEDGEFHRPEPETLHRNGSLGSLFFKTAVAHDWHRQQIDREVYATLYLKCIEELFHAMSVRGHGGTVLWVPKASLPEAEKRVQVGRRLAFVSSAGVDKIQMVLLPDTGPDVRHQEMSTLREYVGMLAQFACVDGALVVDDLLRPIGYAAKISAPRRTATISVMREVDRIPFDLEKRGTRHTSAADFVCAVPGSIALVLSQDGPARAFRRQGEQLLVWPDCRTSVFV